MHGGACAAKSTNVPRMPLCWSRYHSKLNRRIGKRQFAVASAFPSIGSHLSASVRIFVCAAPCSSDRKVPCRSMCSITLEVMTDPVSTADGHVYERSAIEDWLKCAALLSHVCVLC